MALHSESVSEKCKSIHDRSGQNAMDLKHSSRRGENHQWYPVGEQSSLFHEMQSIVVRQTCRGRKGRPSPAGTFPQAPTCGKNVEGVCQPRWIRQASARTDTGSKKEGWPAGCEAEWTGRRERMVASTSKKQTAYRERDMIDEHRPVESS